MALWYASSLKPLGIKENCLILVEGLHIQPDLEQEVQLISLRARGLSVVNKWAIEETCSKEADSLKLLFERFGMAVWNQTQAMSKPQHPLESRSAFSEAILQSWLNRSPDVLCVSQFKPPKFTWWLPQASLLAVHLYYFYLLKLLSSTLSWHFPY